MIAVNVRAAKNINAAINEEVDCLRRMNCSAVII